MLRRQSFPSERLSCCVLLEIYRDECAGAAGLLLSAICSRLDCARCQTFAGFFHGLRRLLFNVNGLAERWTATSGIVLPDACPIAKIDVLTASLLRCVLLVFTAPLALCVTFKLLLNGRASPRGCVKADGALCPGCRGRLCWTPVRLRCLCEKRG